MQYKIETDVFLYFIHVINARKHALLSIPHELRPIRQIILSLAGYAKPIDDTYFCAMLYTLPKLKISRIFKYLKVIVLFARSS